MNLFELQTRANALVQKVNEYEETIAGIELDEDEILNDHTYVDLFSLRMVMHRLFGTTPSDRSSNLTTTTGVTWYYLASSKPFDYSYGNINSNEYDSRFRVSYSDNNDLYSNYNLQVNDGTKSNAYQFYNDKERLITNMANSVYGADIRDALVTECQTANIFKWNTEVNTPSYASRYVVPQQVPGIVCYYLGSGYDGTYTATVPYNTNWQYNEPNNETPALYGAYYVKYSSGDVVSQQAENRGAEGLRMFMPGLTYFNGTSISPLNIYQPYPILDSPQGYNYQGKALYHELVFKRRRAGCSDAGVDFIPDCTVENDICDNDPQGLAMRLALAQQKPYYYNRPWFTELDELYTTDGSKQAALADKIIEDAKNIIYKPDYTKVEKVGDVTLNEDTGIATSSSFDKDNYIAIPNTVQGTVNSLELVMKCSGTETSFGWSSIMTKSLSDVNTASGLSLRGVMGTYDGVIGNRVVLNFDKQDDTTRQSVIFDNLDSGTTGGKYYRYFKIHYDGTNWTAQVTTDDGVTWSDPISPSESPSQEKPYLNQDKFYFFDTYTSTAIKLTELDLNVFKLNINGTNILPQIEAGQSNMTDSEFYSGYQLDYTTYAEALGEPQ